MSSKRDILRCRYSEAYYNAISQVLSGHKRAARFWHALNPNRFVVPFWPEMGQRNLALHTSSKRDIRRCRYSEAYYNAIPQVLSGHKRPAQFWHALNSNRIIAPIWPEMG
jgi:predicted nucleic-acid-binding Zn-ribbon protein